MSTAAFLLCILVTTAIVTVVLGSPLELELNRPATNSFVWYPTPEGGLVKVHLEGGARFDAHASENGIKFYLFTLQNSNTRQELIIGDNEKLDCWASLASAPWYGTAAAATKFVGKKTGRLVEWLIFRGVVTLHHVHLVTASERMLEVFLGSYFGAGRVNRITTLDPALPLFGSKPDSERTYAAFFDVIHTATAAGSILEGGLAFEESRGHMDFYPNSGANQPVCGADMLELAVMDEEWHTWLNLLTINPSKFKASNCDSWKVYEIGQCACTRRKCK